MLFKGETNCEKCIHRRVCSIKNQQDFLDAKRGIEKLGKIISDIFEASVRCKEYREDVTVSVRTPQNIHRLVNFHEEEIDCQEIDCQKEEEDGITCANFCRDNKGNIYPSKDPLPICINCEYYAQKENANKNIF